MKGIILAGGYATRLKPLTDNQPKHLLPINDKPMIEYLIEQIIALTIDHFYLVTNAKFAHNFEEWIAQTKWKDKITIVNDGTTCNEDRLGSIGDMQFVVDKYNLDDDLFVFGADNLTDFDFNEMIKIFQATGKPTVGAYDVGDLEIVKQCSEVGTHDDGKIHTFQEKPQDPKTTHICTCFYIVPKSQLSAFKHCIADGRHDKAGELVAELMKSTDVFAVAHSGYWFDIGTPKTYHEAQEFFKNR